jgi:hypothetical protein
VWRMSHLSTAHLSILHSAAAWHVGGVGAGCIVGMCAAPTTKSKQWAPAETRGGLGDAWFTPGSNWPAGVPRTPGATVCKPSHTHGARVVWVEGSRTSVLHF